MAKLVIFGNGDIARLAHFYFTHDSDHEVVAFTVDPDYISDEHMLGLPVVSFSDVEKRFPPQEYAMFVAVSYTQLNRIRAEKYQQAKDKGYTLVSYISSKLTRWTDAIGDNCFILEDNTLQPFTTIGNNVTLWSGNHIGHDSVIEDHCFLASHIVVSGHVRIGAYTFVGVNATFRNNITVAPRNIIGAGALIMKDTDENGVYTQMPAEKHKRTSDLVRL